MIVFDRKEKEIKVPEGLGNINLTVVDANLEDKTVKIKEFETTILPSSGYNGMSSIEVNARDVYDMGYGAGNSSGFYEGRDYQRQLLTSISINKNGTFRRPNGYNEIVVEVEDTNGDYQTGFDEGYSSGSAEGFNLGYTSGRTDGYNIGYNEGEENGVANAGEIIAQTARVLDITENGTYVSQYSDPSYPDIITGVYPDGENFYNYAKLVSTKYNTSVIPTTNTKIEMWYKPNIERRGYVIGAQSPGEVYSVFKIFINENIMETELAGIRVDTAIIDKWYHIEMSYADGLVVDGVKIGDYTTNISGTYNIPFGINFLNDVPDEPTQNNGNFGMIKITTDGITNVIIPTENGFKNITTDEMLQTVQGGNYDFTEELPTLPEGNLIKTVNVNVQPKIDVGKYGIKFSYSTFTEVPDGLIDWSNTVNMANMFRNTQLNTLKGIDFSNIQDMSGAFYACGNLTNLDYFTPGKSLLYMNNAFDSCGSLRIIPDMDLSSVIDASSLFESCGSIEEIGDINFENATSIGGFLRIYGDGYPIRKIGVFNVPNLENIGDFFYYSFSPVIRDNLTEMGGFIGLKCNWDGGSGLDSCPNLTYQSCINILNGLADVTELGGRTLKVHPNFLTTVGDEINIAISKGWTLLTD